MISLAPQSGSTSAPVDTALIGQLRASLAALAQQRTCLTAMVTTLQNNNSNSASDQTGNVSVNSSSTLCTCGGGAIAAGGLALSTGDADALRERLTELQTKVHTRIDL